MPCTDEPVGPVAELQHSRAGGNQGRERARHEQLKVLLNLQKERIKKEKDLRKGAYELARDEWKELKIIGKRRRAAKRSKTDQAWHAPGCRPAALQPRPFEGEAAIVGPDGATLHIGATS